MIKSVAVLITNWRYINKTFIKLPGDAAKFFFPFRNHLYEVYEWEALNKFGKPGYYFLDIGANIGIISVAMSRLAGERGNVIACEPNPFAYRLLYDVIDLNRCTNTVPLQALIMETLGVCEFNVSPIGMGVRSSVAFKDLNGVTLSLPTVSIDKLIGNDRIDYIKIDAEGSELRILRGAKRTIERARSLYQVELHGEFMSLMGDSPEELFQLMEESNYRCINLPTMRDINAKDFLHNTHCHSADGITGEDMAFKGYGEVLFVPKEQSEILKGLQPRKCNICNEL